MGKKVKHVIARSCPKYILAATDNFCHRLNNFLTSFSFSSTFYMAEAVMQLLRTTLSYHLTAEWVLITVTCIFVIKPEQMVSSLCFSDIVHRDLKLENILVEKSSGDDSGRINIKVRCKDGETVLSLRVLEYLEELDAGLPPSFKVFATKTSPDGLSLVIRFCFWVIYSTYYNEKDNCPFFLHHKCIK